MVIFMDLEQSSFYQTSLDYLVELTDLSRSYLLEALRKSDIALVEDLSKDNSSSRIALEQLIKEEQNISGSTYNFLTLASYNQGDSPNNLIDRINLRKKAMLEGALEETRRESLRQEKRSSKIAKRMLKNLV